MKNVKIDSKNMDETIQEVWAQGFGKVWENPRSETVGASEIFDCPRKVGHRKQVGEPDSDMNGWAARGDILENHYLSKVFTLIFGDDALGMRQDNQFSLRKGRASATPDGILSSPKVSDLARIGVTPKDLGMNVEDGRLVNSLNVEFKTHSPSKNVKYSPIQDHVDQTNAQVAVMNVALELSHISPVEKTLLIYCQSDNIFDFTIYIIEPEEIDIEAIADGLFEVPWHVQPPIGSAMNKCKFCHLLNTKDCSVSEINIETTNMSLPALDEGLKIREEIKVLEAAKEIVDAKIMAELLENHSKNATGVEAKVSLVRRTLKPRISMKKALPILEATLSEDALAELYGASSTSQSLRYTPLKK